MVEQVWCVPGKSPMVKITMYDITLEIAEPVINPVIPALKFLLSQMTCYKKKKKSLSDRWENHCLPKIHTNSKNSHFLGTEPQNLLVTSSRHSCPVQVGPLQPPSPAMCSLPECFKHFKRKTHM